MHLFVDKMQKNIVFQLLILWPTRYMHILHEFVCWQRCKNIVFEMLTRVSFHYLCFRSINVLWFLTKKSEKKGEIEIYFDQKSDKTKNTPRGTFVSWGQNIQYHIPIPQIQEKVYVRDHNLRTNEIFSDKLQPKIMLWKMDLFSR